MHSFPTALTQSRTPRRQQKQSAYPVTATARPQALTLQGHLTTLAVGAAVPGSLVFLGQTRAPADPEAITALRIGVTSCRDNGIS